MIFPAGNTDDLGAPARDDDRRATRRSQLGPATGRLLEAVRDEVGDATFELWLAKLWISDATETAIVIAVPGAIRSWVADRFTDLLIDSASLLAGRPIAVRFEIAPPERPATLANTVPRRQLGGADGGASSSLETPPEEEPFT